VLKKSKDLVLKNANKCLKKFRVKKLKKNLVKKFRVKKIIP